MLIVVKLVERVGVVRSDRAGSKGAIVRLIVSIKQREYSDVMLIVAQVGTIVLLVMRMGPMSMPYRGDGVAN